MIGRPVAFHSQYVAVRPFGMPNADIDEISRDANLWHGLASHRPNLIDNEHFKF